ncbi:MAG: hypothetical protein NXI01_05230 [Gammaproteobacteria bacterium]|nr:hypothetical protein [Gammaproteobacteria bacterium]
MAQDKFYIVDKKTHKARILTVTYADTEEGQVLATYPTGQLTMMFESDYQFQCLYQDFYIYKKIKDTYFQQSIQGLNTRAGSNTLTKISFQSLTKTDKQLCPPGFAFRITEKEFAQHFSLQRMGSDNEHRVSSVPRKKFEITPKKDDPDNLEVSVITKEGTVDADPAAALLPVTGILKGGVNSPSRINVDEKLKVSFQRSVDVHDMLLPVTGSSNDSSGNAAPPLQSSVKPLSPENTLGSLVEASPHQTPRNNTDNFCFLFSYGALQTGLGAVILLLGLAGLTAATLGTSTYFVSAAAVMAGPMLLGLGLFNSTCGHPDREHMDQGSRAAVGLQ